VTFPAVCTRFSCTRISHDGGDIPYWIWNKWQQKQLQSPIKHQKSNAKKIGDAPQNEELTLVNINTTYMNWHNIRYAPIQFHDEWTWISIIYIWMYINTRQRCYLLEKPRESMRRCYNIIGWYNVIFIFIRHPCFSDITYV